MFCYAAPTLLSIQRYGAEFKTFPKVRNRHAQCPLAVQLNACHDDVRGLSFRWLCLIDRQIAQYVAFIAERPSIASSAPPHWKVRSMELHCQDIRQHTALCMLPA